MKSIKTSLFVAAALAVALSFASCSNDTQDVYVTNQGTCINSGKASGTIAYTTTTTTKYSIDSTRFATVEWRMGYEGNTKTYDLEVPYTYGTTGTGTAYVTLKKVNDKYYDGYSEKELVVEGSPEDDEFTITAIFDDDGRFLFTSLKFKKAE